MSDLFLHKPTGFDAIHAGGESRLLSLLPPDPTRLKAAPRLQDTVPLIPRSAWYPTSRFKTLGSKLIITNQGQVGACEACSEVECIGGVRASAGLPKVQLSWSMAYALANGGRDQGLPIGGCYDTFLETGVCREETMPPGFYGPRQIPAKAKAEARSFRPTLAYHCQSFDEVATAILDDFWPVVGVVVGNGFNSFSAEGCTPAVRGIPNHAVTGVDLVRIKSGWGIRFLNHWGAWGPWDDGTAITSEAAYDAMMYQDSIAYQSVTIDAGIDLPGVVLA
jgi:hypothetical protein